jgi:arginyl-tRNA synthetase
MQDKISQLIASVINEVYGKAVTVEIDQPEEQFGDYATNVSLKLAKDLEKSPRDIAENLANKLKENDLFEDVSVAGPGFINLKLSTVALITLATSSLEQFSTGKVVVAEYSDPNPFKVLHGGHLYSSIIGDAIANLLVADGANVHRVNYGGDVGQHVARSMWGIIKEFGGEYPEKLESIKPEDRPDWLSSRYVEGSDAYENDEQAKAEIKELNKRIYEVCLNQDKSSALGQIYWTTRQWSYDYFDSFYARLNIKFEKYYPESEVSDIGLQTVKANIPNVYVESQGAIIFPGENYGLFSNVFINSQGLPTYSAKEVGLIMKKWQDYHYDRSLIITGNDQDDYMRVVLKSVEQFDPKQAEATAHLTHGLVKLSGGQKMSSRKGNILKATDILDLANQVTKGKGLNSDERITIGAVKYSFLKQRIGGDIVYDPNESVSLEGNSGPYLQYAYARAVNILSKADNHNFDLDSVESLDARERSLLRKIAEFNGVVSLAINELRPHYIATYLYDLAQVFNRFYENSRVIGDERQNLRLSLVELYSKKLAEGLGLLGIDTIDKM